MRTAPAPSEPFHRATFGQSGAWWRLLFVIVAGAVALVGLQLVVVTAYRFVFSAATGVGPGGLLALNLALAALIIVAWGLTRWPGGLRHGYVASITGGLRRGELVASGWRSAVVWAPLFALGLMSLGLTGQVQFAGVTVAMLAVVWLTQPLQCAGEEYLFRGALMQALGSAKVPALACCAISAALFSAAHGQFEAALLADRFILGFAFAYVTLATGGLEAAIAMHAAVNVSALTLASLMGGVERTLSPDLSDVGGLIWVAVVVHLVQVTVAGVWIVASFRSRARRCAGGVPALAG